MYTKEQLLQSIPDVPAKFSIEELAAILNRPRSAQPPTPTYNLARPANLTPEAAEWDYYTSPEAQAIYARFPPVSPEIEALRGIIKLREEDQKKTAQEWRAEAIQTKYGL